MAIEVFDCHSGEKLKYIDGWFGVVGVIMLREDEIQAEDEGDDRNYVKFTFCAWDSHLGAWYTLENGEQFPADKLFEFQAALRDAGEWLLTVCQVHKGRFHYIGG